MTRRITCANRTKNGQVCGRFLAEMDGDKLRIFCRECNTFHELPASEVIAHLEAWLAEVKEHAARKVLVGTV